VNVEVFVLRNRGMTDNVYNWYYSCLASSSVSLDSLGKGETISYGVNQDIFPAIFYASCLIT